MRRVCYVSGTRADFGLMLRTLQRIKAQPGLDISVAVTGMHLSPTYGQTIREIEASGLRIAASVTVDLENTTGAAMARAVGTELIGFTNAFEAERPDLVLLLGDRGEMLAGALAALHLNIPIAHIHGGERSGTVDEPVRHAISKLAHYHFTATERARQRLIRMGERPDRVFVTGAPGLDGLTELATRSRAELCRDIGLDPKRPVALVVFHPVVQSAKDAGWQTLELLDALEQADLQALWLMPNADAGGGYIRRVLAERGGNPWLRLLTHLPRPDFAAWMAAADVMAGNSSSGIIEAASFGLPVVNIGERQRDRERSGNVRDVAPQREVIAQALRESLQSPRPPAQNVYGDGQAGERIAMLLASLPLDGDLLEKSNAY